MTKPPHDHSSSTGMPFSWPAAFNSSALLGVTRTVEACSKVGLAWQQEIARFTTMRLQRDGEFGRKLLSSPNWADAVKIQQEWIAAAGQDYADEANRLVQLGQKIGADMMHIGDGGSDKAPDAGRAAAD